MQCNDYGGNLVPEFRFIHQRHTDHATHAYQVLDRKTGETIGYGLTEDHAIALVLQLEERADVV